jgi:hypothetical protein
MNNETIIDLAWLEAATLDDLKTAMRNSDQLMAVNTLLLTPEGKAIASEMLNDPDYKPRPRNAEPTPEEAAQIAADLELANRQAEEATAAAVAEPLATPPVVVPPVEEKKKIVIDYQATAEDGTPIGRPTHIEGWTWEEVSEKQKAAHINAVRYAERVKKNKVQSVENSTKQQQVQEQVSQAEQEANAAVEVAVKEQDPVKMREAINKVHEASRLTEEAKQEARRRGKEIGDAWMADHKEDFLPCVANSKIMEKWLIDNKREFSYENLELAFAATETQLAKPVQQVPVEETPAAGASNTPAVAPVAPAAVTPSITAPAAVAAEPVSTAATPPSQPASTASESTSAAAPNAQSAARRPGVNGGIAPGTLTAARPSAQQIPQTTTRAELLKEIKGMSPEKYRQKLKDTQYVAKLRAAGIPVASNV